MANSDAQHVSNLVMLVARLVRQVRRFDEKNDIAEKAMDYLRRSDLSPSITRGVTENVLSDEIDTAIVCQHDGGVFIAENSLGKFCTICGKRLSD